MSEPRHTVSEHDEGCGEEGGGHYEEPGSYPEVPLASLEL